MSQGLKSTVENFFTCMQVINRMISLIIVQASGYDMHAEKAEG